MREASRPGAWLADVVYTIMLVELGFARPAVKYVAVGNDAYAQLADNLGVEGDRNNSANNLGNMLEFLTCVAFEEMRLDWIVALSAHLACNHGRARA